MRGRRSTITGDFFHRRKLLVEIVRNWPLIRDRFATTSDPDLPYRTCVEALYGLVPASAVTVDGDIRSGTVHDPATCEGCAGVRASDTSRQTKTARKRKARGRKSDTVRIER